MNYQESDPSLKKLQAILAEKRKEVPQTDVESFLIELHRRQRAQLLRSQVDTSFVSKAASFFRGLLTPAYGTAFACAAVALCYVGLHQPNGTVSSGGQATVSIASDPTPKVDLSASTLSAEMSEPRQVPSSISKLFNGTRFSKLAATAQSAELFIPRTLHDSPRFLLANSQVAYDARASF
jgi:hypothetical protein